MMKNRLVQNAKIVDKFLIQYLRRQDKSLLISPMKYGVISGGKKLGQLLFLILEKFLI